MQLLLAFVISSVPVLHDTATDASIRHMLFRFLRPVFDIQLLASVVDISTFHCFLPAPFPGF